MSLFEQIQKDMHAALKSGDKEKVRALRGALSSLKDRRIATGADLSEPEEVKVLQTLVRQHKESLESYSGAGRTDLVAIETAEIELLESYLPQMLSADEVKALVEEVIAETGASGMGAIGKVMPQVMRRAAGRADGKLAQALVRELLG